MNQPTSTLSRRALLGSMATAVTAVSLSGFALAESKTITVWKSPTCGCCKDWIMHLEANGFSVTSHEQGPSSL